MSRSLALAVGLGAAACFDPRAAQPCDGGACVVVDGRGADAGSEGDGPSSDASRAGALALREGLFLLGPGTDVLAGVATSGGFGPIVAGTYGGGSGSIGGSPLATDQGPGPGDVEGVVAAINSLPLSYLSSLPLPTPSSDGSSGIRANKVAVDSTLGLVVAVGTSRVNEPVVFAPGASPDTCPGTWIAAWSLGDGDLAWAHCYPAAVTFARVRIHPTTHQIVVVGHWDGTFFGITSTGVDGFVASVDTAGLPVDSFRVSGTSDDTIDDLAPYGDGWLVAGHDQRTAAQEQAVVWMLDATLREPSTPVQLEVGGPERDRVTALVAEDGASDRFWMAVELGSPTTIAGDPVSTAGALIGFQATPTSLTIHEVLEVDAAAVSVNALAAIPGGVVAVGAARGDLRIEGVSASGVLDRDQPFWGHVNLSDASVGSLAQLDLAGGQGALLDVVAHPDGIYAVGQARGTLVIEERAEPLVLDDGILLRFDASPDLAVPR